MGCRSHAYKTNGNAVLVSNAEVTLPPVETRTSAARAFVRGLLRHCPRCGSGNLFKRWTHIIDHCPRCGLIFEAEEGYWVGAMIWNLVVTELLFVVLVGIGVALTWPELAVWPLVIIGVALNGLVPILFYPVSKTLWVATDLVFLHPHRMTWRRGADARQAS
jgi:uncharacterized protein (DUF983 family)